MSVPPAGYNCPNQPLVSPTAMRSTGVTLACSGLSVVSPTAESSERLSGCCLSEWVSAAAACCLAVTYRLLGGGGSATAERWYPTVSDCTMRVVQF